LKPVKLSGVLDEIANRMAALTPGKDIGREGGREGGK